MISPVVIHKGEPHLPNPSNKDDLGDAIMHEGKIYKISEWPFGIEVLKKALPGEFARLNEGTIELIDSPMKK